MEINWTARANGNLESILAQISRDKPIAAKNFLALVLKKVSVLTEHPSLGRIGKQGTRELVIHDHYIVVYRVTEAVQVLRIKHARQRI